jgi:hypothetical protein
VSNLVLPLVCLCVGIVMGQQQWLPPNTPDALNGVVLIVSLAASILLRVHGIHPRMELLNPVSMPWLMSILICCCFGWLHANGKTIRITLFESAMGPMIGDAIVAPRNDLNPPLITLMMGSGITPSFRTLPGWRHLLGDV